MKNNLKITIRPMPNTKPEIIPKMKGQSYSILPSYLPLTRLHLCKSTISMHTQYNVIETPINGLFD